MGFKYIKYTSEALNRIGKEIPPKQSHVQQS